MVGMGVHQACHILFKLQLRQKKSLKIREKKEKKTFQIKKNNNYSKFSLVMIKLWLHNGRQQIGRNKKVLGFK